MFTPRRSSWLAALCLFAAVAVHAQTGVTGHWEGVIRAPQMDVAIAVDLTKNADGTLAGTFDNPMRQVRAFPLSHVAVDGKSVTFAIQAAGGGVFRGSVNGKTIQGTFATQGTDGRALELPFELTRTGDAKIEAAPKNAAIARELEGTWTGSMEVEGAERRIDLKLRNHADGTATGVLVSDEGTEIPITRIAQTGSRLTADVTRIGGSYEGTLEGGTLSGTWTQGSFSAPLAFRRAGADPVDRWAAAAGGREKVGAIASLYREATLDWRGMQGTIKVWRTPDGRYRKEERIATLSAIEVFDGTNAMLQQNDGPPRALEGAELARVRGTAFANSAAMFFAFFPEKRRGSLAVEGADTVVLRPEGGIDWRVTLDPATSLPKTMLHAEQGRTVTVTFVAWETVDGVRFEKELHRSTGDPSMDSVIRFTKTVTNPPIDPALFTLK